MYKKLIFNKFLSQKWYEYENDTLEKKLQTVQACHLIKLARTSKSNSIKIRSKLEKNELKEKELEYNNQILNIKIKNAKSSNSSQKYFPIKPKHYSNGKKWELISLEKENNEIFKRIKNSSSCYEKEKFDKDFEKSERYKINICQYPLIRTNKDKQIFSAGTTQLNFGVKQNKIGLNTVSYFNTKNKNKKNIEIDENSQENKNENSMKSILFTKIVNIPNLGISEISFYIENKTFVICVKHSNTDFFILIDNFEEILKLQNLYTNYDQMIENIFYLDNQINLMQNKDIVIEYKNRSTKLEHK